MFVYIGKPGTNLNSSRVAALLLFTLFLRQGQALSLACGRLEGGWLGNPETHLCHSPALELQAFTMSSYLLFVLVGSKDQTHCSCSHGLNNSVIYMALYMVIWVCSITQFLKLYYKKSHQIHNGISCYTIPYVSDPFIEDTVPWTWCFLRVLSYCILAQSVKFIVDAL